MPSAQEQSSMNPTVEDVDDESPYSSNLPKSNGDTPPFSWTELLSRHDSVLSSHLEILNSVRGHVRDDEAVRTVSGMVERTNKLIGQFKVVKKQINKTNPFSDMPRSSTSQTHHSRAEPPHPDEPKRPKEVKKRSRSRSRSRPESEPTNPEPEAPIPLSAPKRRREDRSMPGEDEDVRNVTPVSMETEDISEEVNRRLKIKEEKRKKKDYVSEKRKRESITSNESGSPRGRVVKPRAKRMRLKYAAAEGNNEDALKDRGVGNGNKRRESDRSNSEDKRGSKRTRRDPLTHSTS